MPRRILQFGTSRFLQAHVDLFVHEARAAGQDIGPIAVVKTTQDAGREARVAALARPEGFPIVIRGRQQGRVIDETIQVKSVDLAFSAQKDWPAVADLFATETEIVISNVGESGYAVPDADKAPETALGIPAGFPGKLLALLLRRHAAGGRKLLVLPCELVTDNGRLLRRILLDLATDWNLTAGFREWLETHVLFCDTLVDRIVSAPIEPAGAIAEPYALWVIQRRPGFVAPLEHPSVIITDNLEPYARLKLHILNLGHTILAETWLRDQRPANETVGMILKNVAIRERLEQIYRDEVIPGFAAHDMRDEATRYVASTIERFENPFLDHPLRDIAQNHALKIERRIEAFIAWVREQNPAAALPQLTALAGAHSA
jgi:tagaturonate reductase